MGVVNLQNGTIIKVTPIQGNANKVAVITGTEIPFNKAFKEDIIVSGSIRRMETECPAFEVQQSNSTDNQDLPDTTVTIIHFDEIIYDNNSNYNNASATNPYFRAPYDGLYLFNAHVLIDDTPGDFTAGDRMDLRFYSGSLPTSGMDMAYSFLYIVGNSSSYAEFRGLQGTAQMRLKKDTIVNCRVYNGTGIAQKTYSAGGMWSWFQGHLISRYDIA